MSFGFWRDESGLALTEYLILFGLIAGGVAATVLSLGGALGTNWLSWSGLYQTLANSAPQ